tara:strand:+ start:2471 stop:4597 length:2127 start_codon:yes stop_codon:yes gene_type:complete
MIKTLTKSIAFLSALFLPLVFIAQTVVISEVGFRSTASVDDYVELYNTTGSAINLSGYTLVPSTGSTVTLTGTIPANGFYVIGKNTSEISFESSWGVTIGGTSVYQNSSNVLSTTSGVTFELKNTGGTVIDNTIGYGITLGTRLYQCPVGSFEGNDQNENSISYFNPGGINEKSLDDLTHWTVSIYNSTWDVGRINHLTHSENLIIKNAYWAPASSDKATDIYVANSSYIRISTGSVSTLGNLYIDDDASVAITSTGSFTTSGTIYINETGVNNLNKYNLWSTPFTSGATDILTTFSGVNPCDVYTYQATTQEWKSDYSVPFSTTCNGSAVTFQAINVISSPEGTADGKMDIGRGYFIPGNSSTPLRTLTGSGLNNGDINVAVYGSSASVAGGNDWNLVGNPYPCGIWTYKFLQNANNSSLINAIYVYNGDGGYYETYNAVSGFVLASCQGFFVNASSVVDGHLGDLAFTNSMRVNYNTTFRLNQQTMFISLEGTNMNDQIQVILDPESEDFYDNKHDAYKLPNPNNFNIATYIDTELFVFNGIKPVANHQTKTIKLFVETPAAGNYDITLDSLNLIDKYLNIKLEDKLNNTFTDLRTSSFTFSTTEADSITDRFFIHLTNTVTSTQEVNTNFFVSIYSNNGYLNVNTLGETTIEIVTIYDVIGRTIYSSNVKSNEHNIQTNNFLSGIYIVKVIGSNGKETMKRVFID